MVDTDEFEILINKALSLASMKGKKPSADSVSTVQNLAKPDKSTFVVKEFITTGAVIGFFISIFGFMWSKNSSDALKPMVIWFDFSNAGFQFFLWMLFWTIIIIMGIDNETVTQFGLDLLKVLGDDSIDTQAKFEQIQTIIQNQLKKMADRQLHLFRNKKERTAEKTDARTHIIIRQTVPTGLFICYVCALIGFAWVKEIVIWGDIHQSGFQLTMWMIFWTVILVLGVEKGSVVQFALNMLKVLGNERLNLEQKYGLVRQVVQQWIGVMADMSQILELEKQASTDERSISKIMRSNQLAAAMPKLDQTLATEKEIGTVFTQIKKPAPTPFVPDSK